MVIHVSWLLLIDSQRVAVFSPSKDSYSHGNGWEPIQPGISIFWDTRGHRIWPRTPIHIPCMEGILLPPRCDRKPLFRIPSAVEWADGEEDPKDRTLPTNLLTRPPEPLGTSSWAGPCTHKIPFINHLPDSLLSSACSVTSPLSFHGLANHQKSHR